jgi:hypothetical protein
MLQKLLGLLTGNKLIINLVASAATGVGAYLGLCSQTGVPPTRAGLAGAVAVAVGANVAGLFQEKPRQSQATRADDSYDPDAVDKAIERAKVQAQAELASRTAAANPTGEK